jgi:hypothetical protein
VLEPGGRGDLQSPQRLVGRGPEGLAIAAELRGARQQVEHLVLVQVPVQGGGTGRVDELGDGEAAVGIWAATTSAGC